MVDCFHKIFFLLWSTSFKNHNHHHRHHQLHCRSHHYHPHRQCYRHRQCYHHRQCYRRRRVVVIVFVDNNDIDDDNNDDVKTLGYEFILTYCSRIAFDNFKKSFFSNYTSVFSFMDLFTSTPLLETEHCANVYSKQYPTVN